MGEEKKSRTKVFLAVGVLIVLFLMVFVFVRRDPSVRENGSEELETLDVKKPAEPETSFSDYIHQEIVNSGEKKISNELYEVELGEDLFYVDGIGLTYKELPEVIRFYPITLAEQEQGECLGTSICNYIMGGAAIKPLEPVRTDSMAESSEEMEILFGEFMSERFSLSFFGEVLGLTGEEEFFGDLCRELCEELYVGVIHQKKSDVYYLLTADQRFVSKEEVLAFLESVQFSERAFDPAVCEKFSQREQENRENETVGMAAERYEKMQEQSKLVYDPKKCNYYVPLSETEQVPLFDNSFLTLRTENPEQFLLVTGAGFETGRIKIEESGEVAFDGTNGSGVTTENSDWDEWTEEEVWFTPKELAVLEGRGILIGEGENIRERIVWETEEGGWKVRFESVYPIYQAEENSSEV